MAVFSAEEIQRQSDRLNQEKSNLNRNINEISNVCEQIVNTIGSSDSSAAALSAGWRNVSTAFAGMNNAYGKAMDTMTARMALYKDVTHKVESTATNFTKAIGSALDSAADFFNNIQI